jgi:hypothetical protein
MITVHAIKKVLVAVLLFVGFAAAPAPRADAAVVVRRIAPVRRVAARAVLPPYPVARRAVWGPVYRPYYRPYYGGFYGPAYYGPGVSIAIGF